MRNRTPSELLFERFCRKACIPYSVIAPESVAGLQTPDYELHVQVPPILVEVKQIDLNPDDQALLRQLRATGAFAFDDTPGARVRKRIAQANSQLKAHAKPDQPALLVIFNNVGALRGFTDPFQIMSAMYGLPEAVLVRHYAPSPPRVSGFYRLGGRRGLTPKHNTTISALAVLFEGPEGPYIMVYHNKFASAQITPQFFRRYGIQQYSIRDAGPGKLPEWIEV